MSTTEKAALMRSVMELLQRTAHIHPTMIHAEVDWFFNKMGIDSYYFTSQRPVTISEHIQTLYAWKVLHETELKQNKSAEVRFGFERKDSAMFACHSNVSFDSTFNPDSQSGVVEQLLEGRYFLEDYRQNVYLGKYETESFRMQSYRTTGTISERSPQQLRMYFLRRAKFPTGTLKPKETDITLLADKEFTSRASNNTKRIFQEVLTAAIKQAHLGPIIRLFNSTGVDPSEEMRLVVCYKHGTTHSFFSMLTTLYDQKRLYARKKAVEQFKNGWTVLSLHLRALGDLEEPRRELPNVRVAAEKVANDASVLFVLARTALSPLLSSGDFGVKEVSYAFCAWKFAFHFLNRYDEEYEILSSSVRDKPEAYRHLLSLKASLRAHTFSEARLLDVFKTKHIIPVVKELYMNFKSRHHPEFAKAGAAPDEAENKRLYTLIMTACRSTLEKDTMLACLNFNKHLLKTNFYKRAKVALSFRIDPRFLRESDFPEPPHGVFFFVGAEFRGFHVRFTDIARGGLRLIKSRNLNEWAVNAEGLFEENYHLALTQQRKNKDIPEGGSKGTLLLTRDHQHKERVAFLKYIDSMLDLLLVDPAEVVDHHGNEEILFCGPDENTAGFMDLAALHARDRGYKYWRAFTTGKSISMGGIPHDMFGMTTRSVHQYVLGILRKQGKKEADITKFQTGGPDGDLGSNEILISKDKTVAVVDGSGVLHDPRGIDRGELTRLARERKMVVEFDQSKLSPDGKLIKLDARNFEAPDGKVIANGLIFRNNFHLDGTVKSDLFVPCGGRPNSVTIHNYTKLLDDQGKPRFEAIVEGANLFLTQDARLQLEKAGTILYKDASANKGGVTSSSCEVLACLALDDSEHKEYMQVPGGDPGKFPKFYADYVKSVQEVIENNARLEFEVIWREHQNSGVPRCVLTDLVSAKINKLNTALTSSQLWQNMTLRKKAVEAACPKTLVKVLGVEKILERVPETYIQAIFGAFLASRYVYQYGLNASEFEFLDFINNFLQSSKL